MRAVFCILFGVLMVVSLPAVGQEKDKKAPKKKPNTWTEVADAPIDYAIQGEYAADKMKYAAQVVARGAGKFDVYLLQGGLPGAGWDVKSKKIKLAARLNPDKRSASIIREDSKDAAGNLIGTIDPKTKMLTISERQWLELSLPRVERKSATLGAKAPEGAIILFDGKNADAWNPGKMVGDLLSVPNNSKKSFKNFKLHIEFRTPFEPFAGGQGRGNSGVYLGNKEVQVLDSFGLKGADNECGALYGERAPDVNMCLPPLVWQTYDIEHRAGKVDADTKKQGSPTITVRHNGVVVHDSVALKGGSNQGNINLQNHNNPVVYRNIWLVELK